MSGEMIDKLITFLVTLLVVVGAYLAIRYGLRQRAKKKKDSALFNQIVLVGIASLGVIILIQALPLQDTTKATINELLGYAISAIVALSSATFFGNMIAGLLLRIINNFKAGDFVQVKESSGRITERGLFHTELEDIDRNLITLPNLFLVVNPVKVTRSTGTIIMTSVSLGYDVSRLKIEKALYEAAEMANLKDPFVFVSSLGDYSVVYEVHGRQDDVKEMLSATSRLNAMVLDALHKAKIEIISPSFMNQRPIGEQLFIPEDLSGKIVDKQQELNAEKVVFVKSEKAEIVEGKRESLEKIELKIKELKEQHKQATDQEKEEIDKLLKRYVMLKEQREKSVQENLDELKKDK